MSSLSGTNQDIGQGQCPRQPDQLETQPPLVTKPEQQEGEETQQTQGESDMKCPHEARVM